MKQKCILCAAALTILILSGCGKNQNKIEYIGAEQAKQLAVAAAGLTTADTSSLTADMATQNGTDYYQIEFTADGESYHYDIDALTGVIIDAKTPIGSAAGSEQSTADANTASIANAPAASQTEMLTEEEAKAAAFTHAGLSEDQVTVVKCKLERENGREIYDVEFYTADQQEYDYEIDAYSGEILSHDYDAENYLPPLPENNGNGSAITEEQAKALALEQVPGATAQNIREFETDYEDGRAEYEGKIIYNGMEYEFEIDAYSGSFRNWEAEPAD